MPEQLDFNEQPRWVKHAICMAMGGMSKADQDEFYKEERRRDKPIPIVLTLDGFEASFVTVVNRLKDCFDQSVAKAARALVDEKIGEVIGSLYDLQDEIRRRASELFPDPEGR